MAKRMLVDATHLEETRVVVVDGTRLEEFDFETASKKQLKGNIYLAKVVRIEPSLQAAFVEYGGNRHGFLAFSEIHPDYYQIPIADRERLLAEHAQRAQREADEPSIGERPDRIDRSDIEDAREERAQLATERTDTTGTGIANSEGDEAAAPDGTHRETGATNPSPSGGDANAGQQVNLQAAERDAAHASTEAPFPTGLDASADQPIAASVASDSLVGPAVTASDSADAAPAAMAGHGPASDAAKPASPDHPAAPTAADSATRHDPAEAPQPEVPVETLGGDDYERRPRRNPPPRQYKIQEVIKRRQILLVQVVKEERGNKGAALTTYLSLAGRYAVLMPNAGRGGGISRKITNAGDRKRMKEMLAELEVPSGMGVILRTAGLERSKPEIRRDHDYLMRLWDNIRELTFKSKAPALIYEEGDIVKRSIRDLYNSDIEEIQIEGEAGFERAQDFMRQLIPSHVPRVKLYRDSIPLFHRYQIEAQLDAMHSPVVQLRSGAYVVINPTEALVAIDVNSGRATKERNIEETALRTNLDAAEEVARQVRLRDLAGLIVIDFIDMEESKHQGQVERRLKEAMKSDRARIQIGRISPFGLLELSRQRLRPSLLENVTDVCPHCEGTGRVRSVESTALHVLRGIEEEGTRRRAGEIVVKVPVAVALYLLNHKRVNVADAEQRFGFHVIIAGDDDLIPPHFDIERTRPRSAFEPSAVSRQTASAQYEEFDEVAEAEEADIEGVSEGAEGVAGEDGGEDGEAGRRRKRRRRRRRRGDGESDSSVGETALSDDAAPAFIGERNGDARPHDARPHHDDAGDAAPETGDAAPDAEREAGESEPLAAGADDPDGHRRRRRGRRGGRGRRREHDGPSDSTAGRDTDIDDFAPERAAPQATSPVEPPFADTPRDAVASRPAPAIEPQVVVAPQIAVAPPAPSVEPWRVVAAEIHPAASNAAHAVNDRSPERPALAATPDAMPAPHVEPPAPTIPAIAVDSPPEKPKRGWWSRITG